MRSEISAVGVRQGPCGYCSKKGSSYTYAFNCQSMQPYTYELLMQRGWRRCGKYFYAFQMGKTCCLAFTILNHCEKFKLKGRMAKKLNALRKLFFHVNEQEMQEEKKEEKKEGMQEEAIQERKKEKGGSKIAKKQKKGSQMEIQKQKKTPLSEETKAQINFLIQKQQQALIPIIKDSTSKLFGVSVNIQGLSKRAAIFPSSNPKKGIASTNYWMLLYGMVKRDCPKLTLAQFILDISLAINKVLKEFKQPFLTRLQENGYQSFSTTEFKQTQKKKKKEKEEMHKQEVDSLEWIQITPKLIKAGSLEVKIAPAEYSQQKFQLYKSYSQEIHNKTETDPDSFRNFLCLRTLKQGSQEEMGCKHFNYYMYGNLIAVGVCDITPNGLSTVYFFYQPSLKQLNLGTFSSILQLNYLRKIKKSTYYQGFYIQNTKKMAYKGDFEPSFLVCPETYTQVQLTKPLKARIKELQETHQKPVRLAEAGQEVIKDMQFNDKNGVRDCMYKNMQFHIKELVVNLSMMAPIYQELLSNEIEGLVKALGREVCNRLNIQLL